MDDDYRDLVESRLTPTGSWGEEQWESFEDNIETAQEAAKLVGDHYKAKKLGWAAARATLGALASMLRDWLVQDDPRLGKVGQVQRLQQLVYRFCSVGELRPSEKTYRRYENYRKICEQ